MNFEKLNCLTLNQEMLPMYLVLHLMVGILLNSYLGDWFLVGFKK